jgi:ferredoxin
MGMKVVVDMSLCEDNGICVGAAPEIFELDDSGRLQVLDDSPPDGLRRSLEEAVLFCPVQALRIEEG